MDLTSRAVKHYIQERGWIKGACKDAERDSYLRSQGWVVLRVDDRHGEDSLTEQLVRASQVVRMMSLHEGKF